MIFCSKNLRDTKIFSNFAANLCYIGHKKDIIVFPERNKNQQILYPTQLK